MKNRSVTLKAEAPPFEYPFAPSIGYVVEGIFRPPVRSDHYDKGDLEIIKITSYNHLNQPCELTNYEFEWLFGEPHFLQVKKALIENALDNSDEHLF